MKFNKVNIFLGICLGLSGILINIFIENGYVAFICGIIWGMIIFMPQKTSFERYGRKWYPTRIEAEKDRHPPDTIVYDGGLDAYYIKQKKSIWDF